MRQFLTLIAFALAVGGICYVAVNPVGAAYIGDHADAARRIESDLEAKANAALDAGGLSWAEVEMDGQIAILMGVAPREEERAEAIALVRGASGAEPWTRGGILLVRDETGLAPPASPFVWSAARDGTRVTLAGHVPTRATRAELLAHAGQLFPGGVVDQMEIARGAADELAWGGVARTALSQLAALNEGRATLRDVSLTIEGSAADARVRNRVSVALANLPAPFLAAARVEAPEGEGVAGRAFAAAENVEPITDVAECRRLIAEALAGGEVAFAEAEASLTKESYPVLDAVAMTAMRCEGAAFEITVGGDSGPDGAEGYAALGLRRAQHVADYFVLKGLALDRLASRAHSLAPRTADPASDETTARPQGVFVDVTISATGDEGAR